MRVLSGAGIRYTPVAHDSLEVHIGALGMYEYEEITDTALVHRDLRLSSYGSFDYQITKTFGVNTIVYFQPKFNDLTDYRVANESALIFKATKRLEFRVVWSMVYDAFPPEGVPDLNYTLKNNLRFRF